jgi:hypothetical protein
VDKSRRSFGNLEAWPGLSGFRSLKDTWAYTTTPHWHLMLTILGGLAEFERTLIRARTGEGRERAKARGVRFGRPKKLSAHQRREAIDRIEAGEAVVDVARTFGSPGHVLGVLLQRTTGTRFQFLHYRGAGPYYFFPRKVSAVAVSVQFCTDYVSSAGASSGVGLQGTLLWFIVTIAAPWPTVTGRSPPNIRACPKPPSTNFFARTTFASPRSIWHLDGVARNIDAILSLLSLNRVIARVEKSADLCDTRTLILLRKFP